MKKPFYLSDETWESLSWKEQDFIVFLREKRYTKEQIMRKLYITSSVGYWKLQNRVSKAIKVDISKVNENK